MNCLDDYKVEFYDFTAGDIPDKEYFAIPAVSISRLKLLDSTRGGSWEKYKEGFTTNLANSLAIGSACHNAILSPDEYIISDYSTECTAKLKYFIECLAEFRRNSETKKDALKLASEKADYYKGKLTEKVLKNAYEKGRDYYKRLYLGEFLPENNDGKIVMVLDHNSYDTYKECIDKLTNNSQFKKLFEQDPFSIKGKDIKNEVALIAKLSVTLSNGNIVPIIFKGKADNIIIDHDNKIIYLNDVKTTSKSLKTFMNYQLNDTWYAGTLEWHLYYVQLFIYTLMLQGYFKKIGKYLDYSYKSCILAVETTLDHNAEVIPINNSIILEGKKDFKRLICELAEHIANGD